MTRHQLRARDFLEHIEQAATRVQQYLVGKDSSSFLADKMVQDAVIWNLGILGEVSKNVLRVMPDAPARFPDIPFVALYSMRNRLNHGYFVIDLDIVWKVATEEIAPLLKELPAAIASLPPNP